MLSGPGLLATGPHSGLRLPTRPLRKPPELSGCGREADADSSFGTASFALPAAFLAVVLALLVAFFAVAFTPVGFFAAAVVRFAVVPAFAVVFFAAEVVRAVVLRPPRPAWRRPVA